MQDFIIFGECEDFELSYRPEEAAEGMLFVLYRGEELIDSWNPACYGDVLMDIQFSNYADKIIEFDDQEGDWQRLWDWVNDKCNDWENNL